MAIFEDNPKKYIIFFLAIQKLVLPLYSYMIKEW